ncbi:MAG TPA: hypothetical protein VFX98_17690, partial [Longimicrobiaceae bacterium]|nr:hypothetical protein [Longimicrobiaceae bacterium]
MPVLALEGASAVGKSTTARALADALSAEAVLEDDARFTGPYLERHLALWRWVAERSRAGRTVVLDGDPFKALWFGWVYPGEGWTPLDALEAFYRPLLMRGEVAFPAGYALLEADEAALRTRRAGDPTRRRRRFEKHLRLVEPLRRYFAALEALSPGRVLFLRAESVAESVAALRGFAGRVREPVDSDVGLFDGLIAWLR